MTSEAERRHDALEKLVGPPGTSTCRAGLLCHVVDPGHQPTPEKAKAAQEWIDVVKAYLK